MPPLDLTALRATQTETARARLALNQSDAARNAARQQLRSAETALNDASRVSELDAMSEARRAVEENAQRLDAANRQRAELADALRRHLADFARLAMDAPADVPLLLLPIRLETRYGQNAAGQPILKIRIYPDDIHMDLTDPGLNPVELTAATAYWVGLFAAADDSAIDAAWATLRGAVGRNRVRFVAHATRPTNPEARGTGVQPIFPAILASQKSASRPRLLPDRFHVTAFQNGRQLRAEGAAVEPELRVGLLADDGSDLVDHDGLKMLEGTEWLTDYDLALKFGMAISLPLPAIGAPVERLYVYGVNQSRTSGETAAELATLLAAHDGGPGLSFIPQGTPTNNTEAAGAGWQRWSDPAPVPLVAAAMVADSNAAVTGAALGLGAGAALLADLPHASDRETGAAGAMNTALWPATWGYFLETLDQGNEKISPQLVEDLRHFHRDHLRGRGALPAICVGDQPYGILPFAGFGHRFQPHDGGKTEAGLAAFLRKALPNWLNAVPQLPRVVAGSTADTVLQIFGQAPVSWGVRARKCLSGDFLTKIEAVSGQGKDAADIEVLLTRLLAESLGNFSYVYGAGSLDIDSRPVALPYADPARDAGFADALLNGTPTGAISSVFQALISLGYQRLKIAATPTPATPDALRATSVLDAQLTERVIGAVMADHPVAPAEYDQLLAQVIAVAPQSPFVTTQQFQPVTAPRDNAALALSATSAVDRDRYGVFAASGLLLARRQLADMTAGLATLIALAKAPGAADLTLLVAETLDTASHRLDAWITGLSSSRLVRLRAAQPAGLTVGAFGWLLDLAPQQRGKLQGGHIATPALDLATTAGLLRSAYLAHNPSDGTGGAFAIDLSSARVRRALSLIEGIANGQVLGALLGYNFERRLHDARCDRFILSFRALAPLTAGRLTGAGSPTNDAESQAPAAVNVTDVQQLLLIWNDPARGPNPVFAKLAQRPDWNEYLDPGVVWAGPDAAQKQAIEAAMAEAANDADAVADLLLAESVHQLAQGNMARASAALDAGGRGEAPPPAEPDVIQTTGPGTIVTHRLIAVLPATPGWTLATPRSQVSPGVESWAASRLPPPDKIVLGPRSGGGLATLADTGLAALDFTALCRNPANVELVLRRRAPLANLDAAFIAPGSAQIPQGSLALAEAALTGAALQAVLDNAQVLNGQSVGLSAANGWLPAAGAVTDAQTRLASAAGLLQARLLQLQSLMAGANVQRADLLAALVDLSDFGILLPDLSESQAAALAHLALAEATQRLGRAQTALAAPASPARIAEVALALFGPGMPVPLPQVFAPDDPAEAMGNRPFTAAKPGEVERYLADFGTVRPALGRYQRLNLLAGITGQRPKLVIRQFCGRGDNPPDHWIGADLPPDRPSPAGVVVSVLADAPDGFDPANGVTGLLLDEWTETMARRAPKGTDGPIGSLTTAGVALHADAPGAEPPQSLILALSPDGLRWTEDSLCDLLTDTLDLAKARLVTLETLPLAARILPAIYTHSASLQGEIVIDWSKILFDARQLATSHNLKYFTMLKEV